MSITRVYIYSLAETMGRAEHPPLVEDGATAVEASVLIERDDEGPGARQTRVAPHDAHYWAVRAVLGHADEVLL